MQDPQRAALTIEEAADIVLGEVGRITCSYCRGEAGWLGWRGDIDLCSSCEGTGNYMSRQHVEARELLGLPRLCGQVYETEPDPENPIIRSRDYDDRLYDDL